MPFSFQISDQEAEKLDRIAEVLVSAREGLILVAEGTGWDARSGSHAETDLASQDFPEQWNATLVNMPRVVASVYLRVGADHLAGLSALLRQREVWFAPGALARAALEHGARAFWVLDPKLPSRARFARAMLEELASANFSKQAVSHLGGKKTASYQLTKERWERLATMAREAFNPCDLRDDPFSWQIEGEGYERITDVVEAWAARRDDKPPGRGLYDALSLYPHPQGLAGREEMQLAPSEPTGTRIVTDVSHIARHATAGLAAWYDGFMLLTTYHGIEHPITDQIEEASKVLYELSARNETASEET